MADEKILSVRMYGEPIGLLEQTPTGKMQFTYEAKAPYKLSIDMEIREQPYDEIRTEAYFGGLLPESTTARQIIGRRYGANYNNSFALLRAIGYDCAGAVSLHALEDSVASKAANLFQLEGKIFSESEVHRHIQELPKKPLFLGVAGLRISLAGAQDKAAVCLIDNQIALPANGCPTTHILKPEIKGYEGSVQNEYLCLKIAARIGLTVPKVEIRFAEKTPYLLIERYDRIIQNNKVSRRHQEDFCQALGVMTANKYQSDGGPNFQDCLKLLRNTNQPIKDRNALAELMVFNYLIGNMDAHGKNFSLVHYDKDHIKMAPVYDVLCTRVYGDLAKAMAMKIGGHYEHDKIYPRHWERESKEMAYSYPALREIIYRQSQNILEAAETEREQLIKAKLSNSTIDEMLEFFNSHISKTIKRFDR